MLPSRDRAPTLLLRVVAWSLCAQSCFSQRLLSGQKICYGDSAHPCYKIAYFQDMSRRVSFQEAHQACEMGGGVLLSLESEAEQKLIEHMLQNLTKSGPGISDGDFWIGLWRNGEGQITSTACPDLYKWTDGSSSLFRKNKPFLKDLKVNGGIIGCDGKCMSPNYVCWNCPNANERGKHNRYYFERK